MSSIRFDVITIFPQVFGPYLNESILKRAQEKKLLKIRLHDLRDFTRDKRKKVDGRPYGGGPGMVLAVEPLARALLSVIPAKAGIQRSKTKIILFSAAGKRFDAKMAVNLAKRYDHIIMIAGRYEGVDERVKKLCRIQEISIGPYVLTGGELPALVVIDAVARHIPGVLGSEESLEEKRHGIGVPVYTRPEVFEWKKKKHCVPSELLSGDHKKIEEWRKKHVRSDKTL